jgi:predicted acyl esterase
MIQFIDVPVRMRDGVNLSADVRLPAAGERFPAVLIRHPYGNAGLPGPESALVAQGYALATGPADPLPFPRPPFAPAPAGRPWRR